MDLLLVLIASWLKSGYFDWNNPHVKYGVNQIWEQSKKQQFDKLRNAIFN